MGALGSRLEAQEENHRGSLNLLAEFISFSQFPCSLFHPQGSNGGWSHSHALNLSQFSWRKFSDYSGQSPYFKICTSIILVKSNILCKVTHSQVLGIPVWTSSWGGSILPVTDIFRDLCEHRRNTVQIHWAKISATSVEWEWPVPTLGCLTHSEVKLWKYSLTNHFSSDVMSITHSTIGFSVFPLLIFTISSYIKDTLLFFCSS